MENNTDISSGLLESYVLGTCTAEENKRVNELCKNNPAILAEVEAIEKALMEYAAVAAPKISPTIKTHLLEKINRKITPPVTDSWEKAAKTRRFYKKINLYLAAAAIIVVVLGIPFCYIMYTNAEKLKSEVALLQEEKKRYGEQANTYIEQAKTQQEKLDKMSTQIALLSQPETKKVKLNSTGGTADVAITDAMVYWNSNNHQTYINVDKLPPPPTGKQYQLWAIVDGKPVDAGVLSLAAINGLQKMKDITNAQAFAITIENEGGSSVPTLTAMCLAGNV